MDISADACQGQSGSPVWINAGGKHCMVGMMVMVMPTTNLAIRLQPQARQLNADLSLWMKIIPAQSKQKHKLDAEQLQRLKSLGYVQ